MMEDTAQDFRRNSFRHETWKQEVATSCNGMTNEQQSRVKLARLIQKQDDSIITPKEQMEMADELESVLTKYPRMAQETDDY